MKIIRRFVYTILIFTIVILLFRGPIYRLTVTYKPIYQRPCYPATDEKLIEYINKHIDNKKDLNIDEIIQLSLSVTSRQLNFTTGKNCNDPNNLIESKTANCIGYAAFFSTTCNRLLKQLNLDETWKATPQKGQLYFLGINIHKYFNSAFLKDHDFVIIENKETEEILAVDPTINDYFWIDFVTVK